MTKKSVLCRLVSKQVYCQQASLEQASLWQKNDLQKICRLDFEWQGPSPRAGQFFMVRPERTRVLLGRPISVFSRGEGRVSFLVAERGQGTADLTSMNEWEAAALLGPLGNCFSDFADKADGGPVQLASGGIGAAPLLFWAEELLAKGVEFGFYAGFKSIAAGTTSAERRGLEPFYSLIEDRLPGAVIVTEDGSGEKKGLVTDYFAPGTGGTVYTCGPLKMMTVVMEKCRAGGAECFVSMERRMACGVGACLGCAIPTTTGNRRCCADGPIFNARDIGKRH